MIRAANNADFDYIFSLYMHPQLNPYLLYEPMDQTSFRPIFEQLLADQQLYLYYVNEEKVGMFKLIRLQHRTSHIAYLGGVAIAPEFTGKGLGTSMINAIIEMARQKNIRRIELSTSIANERAAQLYQKCGFQREGILRQYTYLASEGRYIDEVLMSLILD